MNTAIILLLLIAVVLVPTAIVFGIKLYRYNKTFPEDARVENLHRRYHELLNSLNEAVDTSNSELSLLNALQAIQYPTETSFVSLFKKGSASKDGISIIDKTQARRQSSRRTESWTLNGGGFGRHDDSHFFILRHKTNKYNDSRIELWFDSDAPIVTA